MIFIEMVCNFRLSFCMKAALIQVSFSLGGQLLKREDE